MLGEIHVKRHNQQGFSLFWAPKNTAPLPFDEILGGIYGGLYGSRHIILELFIVLTGTTRTWLFFIEGSAYIQKAHSVPEHCSLNENMPV